MKNYTNSIVAGENDFDLVSEVLSELENALHLEEIAVMPEYGNILFDCTKENAETLMDVLMNKHPNVAFRLMQSDGDIIEHIYEYDGEHMHIEHIGKTMDEIAKDASYACSGSCSECSSDCGHAHHGEHCDCEECKAEHFDLDTSIEMCNELATEPEEVFFPTLVKAYEEELSRFANEQSEEDADAVYDLFANNVAQIVIAAAACDDSYTLREHNIIEQLIGENDFDRLKSSLQDIIPDNGSLCKSLKYWRDAELYGYEVRRLVLMLCTFVCCADAPANETEYKFLSMLEKS